MRIGDVALAALDGQPAGQAAAPADLDHIAQLLRIGGLAHEATVDLLALRVEPLQHLPGAIDGRSFLIARYQQRDAALGLALLLEKGCNSRHESGNRALHVAGAATDHLPGFQASFEGPRRPALEIARR